MLLQWDVHIHLPVSLHFPHLGFRLQGLTVSLSLDLQVLPSSEGSKSLRQYPPLQSRLSLVVHFSSSPSQVSSFTFTTIFLDYYSLRVYCCKLLLPVTFCLRRELVFLGFSKRWLRIYIIVTNLKLTSSGLCSNDF